ncbi:NYN domain-containing protein [uncultured Porphyromonas sp.]|uniref:NYN domain-containing protein n=1 Tax=uncultured Porphyromonas sp. TaxID=159274 RepID=UPI002617A5D9|nr:NYN domain-containing protein [uncultured Porphyromonas sp.]
MLKEKKSHLTRVGVFYDGNYFWHVSTFYYQYHERKSRLSVGGLHRFLKYQIAQLEGTSPELCKIVDAHYFRGRLTAPEAARASGDVLYYERLFDDVLNAEGVTMHHLPLSRAGKGNKKKEKGVDVLFALEAYERALQHEFDVVVLIAADGDYIPLVRKLHALGTRVMILGWDLEHEGEARREPATTYTSFELLEEATYPIMMNELIDSRAFRSDPIINGLFVNKGASEERSREVKGRPYQAPTAHSRPIDSVSVDRLKDDELPPAEEEKASAKDDKPRLAQAPEPEVTLSVQDSIEAPEVKVIGHIDLPEAKPTIILGEELPSGFIRGQINTLKAGFGFIDVGVKENAFFHYKSLNGVNFNDLLVGDFVEVHLSRNDKGQLVASDVTLLGQ